MLQSVMIKALHAAETHRVEGTGLGALSAETTELYFTSYALHAAEVHQIVFDYLGITCCRDSPS